MAIAAAIATGSIAWLFAMDFFTFGVSSWPSAYNEDVHGTMLSSPKTSLCFFFVPPADTKDSLLLLFPNRNKLILLD